MYGIDWSEDGPEAQFVERLGRLLEEDGGPRIGGRILGLLLLAPAELSLEEIAERLRVSKASVSTNARMLEHFGVLERVSHPGDRRDFYRVGPDSPVRMLERRMEWMRRLSAVVADGAKTPAAGHPAVQRRFRALCEVQRHALSSSEETLRHLREMAAQQEDER